jgi:hypothetical protein
MQVTVLSDLVQQTFVSWIMTHCQQLKLHLIGCLFLVFDGIIRTYIYCIYIYLRCMIEQLIIHTKVFEELIMSMECQVYWFE